MQPQTPEKPFTSIEICAGAGGQALGLEQAGFEHLILLEIEPRARETLKLNRPQWNVPDEGDIHKFDATPYRGKVDLLAGGVPCPPFSVAGKQLGHLDERDLFPEALRLMQECQPRAVLLENVRGLLDPRFDDYREQIDAQLYEFGYIPEWRLLQASTFGVPQLRPRAILVALRDSDHEHFQWPDETGEMVKDPPTVGEVLRDLMAARGWKHVDAWVEQASGIAPTLVGGSRKHGGPDLGPRRARDAWEKLGVDGSQLANEPPDPDFQGMPRLTVEMAALIQGFPPDWKFAGKKTPAYRQVGNAFPPPVAEAIGRSIIRAFIKSGVDVKQLQLV